MNKAFIIIAMTCLIAIILVAFNLRDAAYRKGWNDAIDAVPKAIILNPSWETLSADPSKLPIDCEGRPAFVCKSPGVPSEIGLGGDFLDITQIFPEKR